MLCVEISGVKIKKGSIVLAEEFELDLESYGAGFEGFSAGKCVLQSCPCLSLGDELGTGPEISERPSY